MTAGSQAGEVVAVPDYSKNAPLVSDICRIQIAAAMCFGLNGEPPEGRTVGLRPASFSYLSAPMTSPCYRPARGP